MTSDQIIEWGEAHGYPCLILSREGKQVDRLLPGEREWRKLLLAGDGKRIERVRERIAQWDAKVQGVTR